MAEVLIRHVYWEFAAYSRHSVALQLIKGMHDVWKFQVTLHVSDLSQIISARSYAISGPLHYCGISTLLQLQATSGLI